MDFTRMMPNYFKERQAVDEIDDTPLTEEELAEIKRERHKHAPKHGPVRARWITTGQQRRAQTRWADTRSRKANLRYRKAWMANEAAFQRLRSQLDLLVDRPDSALVPGVVRVLEQNYGSVDAAREHFANLVAERAANARRSA